MWPFCPSIDRAITRKDVRALFKVLQNPDSDVRKKALGALWHLVREGVWQAEKIELELFQHLRAFDFSEVWPMLERRLDSGDTVLRDAAIAVLRDIAKQTDVGFLVDAYESSKGSTRKAAVLAVLSAIRGPFDDRHLKTASTVILRIYEEGAKAEEVRYVVSWLRKWPSSDLPVSLAQACDFFERILGKSLHDGMPLLELPGTGCLRWQEVGEQRSRVRDDPRYNPYKSALHASEFAILEGTRAEIEEQMRAWWPAAHDLPSAPIDELSKSFLLASNTFYQGKEHGAAAVVLVFRVDTDSYAARITNHGF